MLLLDASHLSKRVLHQFICNPAAGLTSSVSQSVFRVWLQALAKIGEQEAALEAAHAKANDLKAGMDIFSIPQPPYKELASMRTDLDKLTQIWGIVEQWEASYNTWKQTKFKDVQVCCMPLDAAQRA